MVEMAEEPLVETPAIPLYQIAAAAKPMPLFCCQGKGAMRYLAVMSFTGKCSK